MPHLLLLAGVLFAVVLVLWLLTTAIRYIPNNRVGVVEKLVSLHGSIPSGFIALRNEAGFQPDVLRGGFHLMWPFIYRVHRVPLVTIPQGQLGYVFARDGQSLPPTQSLASNARVSDFHDVRAFLAKGGQRGPQRFVLREGTHAINLSQFVVLSKDRVYSLPISTDAEEELMVRRMSETIAARGGFNAVIISEDKCGIVTVHDGPTLEQGEIIAPTVGDDRNHPDAHHANFQDPERFLAAGGRRGKQLQVLVEGTFYINRLFATVELIPKTIIDVGTVGVVVSFTGHTGEDLSGVDYKHGEMVATGERGVWAKPLMPGKYAFNTHAAHVIPVPTTNIILKWIKNQTGSHKYDENLSEVSLITKDAFEPSLPLSVVIHIDYRKAPLVVQRFGDIKRLVEQTLDPMVAAHFKNIGQTRTLIQLVQERSEIQKTAAVEMREKFARYNLELEEVLIGTPSSSPGDKRIEDILEQLRARQIANEQVETYNRQEVAAVKERELREAEQRARQQASMTESELSIVVQTNQGKAEYQRSLQQAAQIRALAEAEAAKIRALAEAEADKTARIGVAQAIAMEEQVRAYGGPQFQVVQHVMNRLAEAVERSGADVVPKVVVSGGNGGATGGLLETVMTLLMSEKLGLGVKVEDATPRDKDVTALRDRIRRQAINEERPRS
jgi:uncharacterized membrane protein YqiK